ncbi:hypothetical protein DPMN_136399 [Dreissena polymorpha]|uniref:Uncharacterized protein n=1 Tax=Dreissena polymorpha TaxID=45954 RepID=A0A9D4G0S7_DREPO|nr:hypothetical protein DPMN_136399 [Dreissena polymorpha]
MESSVKNTGGKPIFFLFNSIYKKKKWASLLWLRNVVVGNTLNFAFIYLKVRWRNTTVNTLEDVVETVRLSSRNGHNIPHLVQDPENPVQFYNWTEFLKPVFKPIPNLLSYHHLRMTSDKPGIVYVRRYASDAEEAVKILKKDSFVLNGMPPPQLEPLGLSAERQWYLHDEIAPLCNSLCASTCPRSDVPKPTK